MSNMSKLKVYNTHYDKGSEQNIMSLLILSSYVMGPRYYVKSTELAHIKMMK